MNEPDPKHDEYNDDRDMNRFWSVATSLTKEPVLQKWFLPALLLCIVISVPWYLPSGESGAIIGGLPIWVWTSLGCTIGIGILTAIGALIYWKDPNDE